MWHVLVVSALVSAYGLPGAAIDCLVIFSQRSLKTSLAGSSQMDPLAVCSVSVLCLQRELFLPRSCAASTNWHPIEVFVCARCTTVGQDVHSSH